MSDNLPAGGDGGGSGEGVLSPEAVLETLGQQTNEAAIFPVSTREEFLFAYDLLLEQTTVGRFVKGNLAPRIVVLPNHSLTWPYYFPPAGSALPNIERTNREQDAVWGVLYTVQRKNLQQLEQYLRVPNRYHRHMIGVHDRGGRRFSAFTYVLTVRDNLPGKPSVEYRDKLVSAAAERELPAEWIARLKLLETGEQ